ncbi:MAG TPA: FAD:protein FMN transferase [Phycisphaerales bacterium]|nr:FAD:protein FMN transferase [Phycisphaerales bacterium]
MPQVFRHACHAMGTRFELVLAHEDGAHARAAAEAAAEEVLRLHALWSPFDPASAVAHLNREATTRAVRADHDTFALLSFCKAVHAQSNGAFDITLGHLMHAHGWRTPPLPEEGAVAERSSPASSPSLPAFGSHHLHLDAATQSVFFSAPISLDLGAVAKGWALDAAAGILREAGITSALLHAGTSSVLAIGAQPDTAPWRIQLSPQAGSPAVTLRDNALSISAPHGRVTTDTPGALPTNLSHTLDPRTGLPTAPLLHAATIAPTAALADAWSTALLVLGHLPPAAAGITAIVQSREGPWHRM